jgi:glyoxylase-like metal-dependent hydrolase (beta-lactamase superfamily II)
VRAADQIEDPEPVDVAAVLPEELGDIRATYPEVEVELTVDGEAYVPADDLPSRVFSNLLSNAVEHNPSESPTVAVTVSTTPDVVRVAVADDGPGVPEAERETLFERTQEDHGLGLYLVRVLADRYDGTVELAETGPDGSVFAVELPRAEAPSDGEPDEARPDGAASASPTVERGSRPVPDPVERLQEPVGEGRLGHHVGGRGRGLVGVGHRVGAPDRLEDRGVVLRVPDRDELRRLPVQEPRRGRQPAALVDVRRLDVVGVSRVDDLEAAVGGDALEGFQRLLPSDRQFGLPPAVHLVEPAPPEVVPLGAVGLRDRLGALAVALDGDLLGRAHVDDAAVLGDDVPRDPEELTEPDGVGEGLPCRDDDRGRPGPQRVGDAGVDGLVRPGQRTVDVDGQRRHHTGRSTAAGIKPPDGVRRPMPVTHAVDDVHTVDPHLLGTPGALSMYLLDAPEPALVDTGAADTVPQVLAALEEVGVDREAVAHVLVTHVHLDHAGGAGHLSEELPNATFHVHEAGLPYVTEAERLDRLKASVDRAMDTEDAYGEPELLPESRCRTVSGGERVDLGDRELELIDAPGHAPHHYAAFDPATEGMFSIDAAGMHLAGEMRPTTPPPGFDLEANLETVDRLRAYDPERNFYGHYGPGGGHAVRELDRYERLLPDWVEVVEAKRREHDDDVGAMVEDLGAEWQSPTVHRDVAGVMHYLDSE